MNGLPSCMCLSLLVLCLTAPPSQGIKACGKNLNDVLALFCKNGFTTKVKKSIDPLDYYADSDGAVDAASALEDWPFMDAIENNSLTKFRRKRLGVVNECCLKSCSKSELMSYCRKR